MIPLVLKIQISGHNQKHRNIWVPLLLVYILLIILIILLAPLLFVGCIVLLIIKGINMFKALPVFFSIWTSLSGFLIDVRSKKHKFQITLK
ncbi:MAG: hypothetical protein P8X68_12360 [Desulfobacterales bacterium]|jgi:hypothetical protein